MQCRSGPRKKGANEPVYSFGHIDTYIRIHPYFYGFPTTSTDALFLNKERESYCLLTDLPLFHVSNQVRGRKRVKPGAMLVAHYSYIRPSLTAANSPSLRA